MKTIYLDYAATTPVRKEALKAMMPYFSEEFGNPMSLHRMGAEAKAAVEKARAAIAKTINAHSEEIVFTSGSTESTNLAIKGVANARTGTGKHLMTTTSEHEAAFNAFKFLETKGFTVTYLPVDIEGLVSVADVRSKITPKTTLLSIQHSNGEIGTVQPAGDIARIAQEKGVLVHTDATFSYGMVPLDVKAMKVDLMTIDSHHIYGPKGVGALYVKDGVTLEPLFNGKLEDHGRRPGTQDVPGIVGFAAAAELAAKEMKKESKRETKLRNLFINHIEDNVKFVKFNGHLKRRLPNSINFSFDGIVGADIVKGLEKHGILTTTCANCRILEAIGVRSQKLTGSVRLTLGRYTTEKDVRFSMKMLQKVVEDARKKY